MLDFQLLWFIRDLTPAISADKKPGRLHYQCKLDINWESDEYKI